MHILKLITYDRLRDFEFVKIIFLAFLFLIINSGVYKVGAYAPYNIY